MLRQLWELFYSFCIVGVTTFGGGYAMLPALQREIVEKKKWATDEEVMDWYAIGQCTPGVIAVNTATFVGEKQAGRIGGIVASLGVVFPSLVIITVIAAFIQGFADLPAVKNAFAGIRACVCVLILNAVVKLWISSRGSAQLRDRTHVSSISCTGRQGLYHERHQRERTISKR